MPLLFLRVVRKQKRLASLCLPLMKDDHLTIIDKRRNDADIRMSENTDSLFQGNGSLVLHSHGVGNTQVLDGHVETATLLGIRGENVEGQLFVFTFDDS